MVKTVRTLKRFVWFSAAGLPFSCTLLLQGGQAQPVAPIAISGSSTVGPVTALAIKGFQATGSGRSSRFTPVVENGTSAGFRQFCSGKTAISNASRPINTKELRACRTAGISFYELPIGFDAITVVVNPGNTWARDISVAELKKLWARSAENKVTRWDQVRSSWPAKPIRLFNPGRDSGTFDYFTKAITGEEGNARTDAISSENDQELVRGVAGSEYGIGYFGFAYYSANTGKLRALAVGGPKGKVLPSLRTVQNETYQPLSRPMFIYVNAKQMVGNPSLRSFINYFLNNAGRIVEGEGSVPLSDSQYRLVKTKLSRQIVGTAFGGDLPIGLTLGQLLNRSFDQIKRPQFRL
jgi:phosphate transport system substrate-binding protein